FSCKKRLSSIHSLTAENKRKAGFFEGKEKLKSEWKKAFFYKKKGNLARALIHFCQCRSLLSEILNPLQTKICKEFSRLHQEIHDCQGNILKEFLSHFHAKKHSKEVEVLLEALILPSPLPHLHKKILLEIQSSYLDTKKHYYKLSILPFLFTFGKKSWRQELLFLPLMKKLRSLDRMERKIKKMEASPHKIQQILNPIHFVREQSMNELEEKVAPLFRDALKEVGIQPREWNFEGKSQGPTPSQLVAFQKIQKDFIRILSQKYHTKFSDLRDILSRNLLPIHDLRGPKEYLLGDQLFQLDSMMGKKLNGVHQSAEVYMQVIHRISSFLFGWQGGRWFSKYFLLPFGGGFVIYEALNHILSAFGKGGVMLHPVEKALDFGKHHWEVLDHFIQYASQNWFPKNAVYITHEGEKISRTLSSIELQAHAIHVFSLFLWIFIFGILFQFFFYTRLGNLLGKKILRSFWLIIKFFFWQLPRRIWNWKWVQFLYRLRFWQYVHTFLFKPLFYSLLVSYPLYYFTHIPEQVGEKEFFLFFFVMANGFMNTPLGRNFFDYFEDRLNEGIHKLNKALFVNLFHFIMEGFKQVVHMVEKVLYYADDFFRFRKGDRVLMQFFKAMFGKLWYAMNYLIRFTINLVIEPQINPIKHFPIVTVSHKIILPIAILSTENARVILGQSLGKDNWITWAGVTLVFLFTQFGIPGICGFMAWEFRENWKLYCHGKPQEVKPLVFGSHGEDMARMLCPGFHSGTLPKIFRNLRREAWKDYWEDSSRLGKWKEKLHHAKEDLSHFYHMSLGIEFSILPKIKSSFQILALETSVAPYRVILSLQIKAVKENIIRNYLLNFDLIESKLFGYGLCFKDEKPFPKDYENPLEYLIWITWKKGAVQFLGAPLFQYLN
ncbi:MAG: hypothetical protein D6785_06485, partial [Planctomycetota bacterium]